MQLYALATESSAVLSFFCFVLFLKNYFRLRLVMVMNDDNDD